MTVVHELRTARVDQEGARDDRQRSFRVFVGNTQAALNTAGVPVEGDEHPDSGRLIALSRFATREEGLQACVVQVNYGPRPFAQTGGESQPAYDAISNLGELSIDVQASVESAAYPILRERIVTTPQLVPDGSPPEERVAWGAVPASATRVMTVATIRTATTLSLIRSVEGLFSAFRPTTEQTGVLHKIGADYYRYESRLINQATAGDGTEDSAVWNVEHSWTFDPGVPVPSPLPDGWGDRNGGAVGNDRIRLPSLPAPLASEAMASRRYIVPPYCDVLYDELELPNASLIDPSFFARLIYAVDETGYVVLPGLVSGLGGG